MGRISSAIVLNISQVVTIVVSVLFQILLIKFYDIHKVGVITSFISLSNILSNIFCFGLNNYMISKFSHKPALLFQYKNIINMYILITGLLSIFILIGFGMNINSTGIFYIMAFIPQLLSLSLVAVMSSIMQLKRKYISIGVLMAIIPSIKLVSLLLSYILNKDLNFFLLLLGIFSYVLLILLFIFWSKSMKYINAQIPLNNLTKFIKEVMPYGILNLCFLIYTNSPIVILGFMGYTKESAYLSTAYLIVNCILMIPTLLIQKIYASSIYIYIYEKNHAIFKFLKNIRLKLLIYGLIIYLSYFLIGKQLIKILFTEESFEITHATNILLLSLLFRLASLINGTVLTSNDFVNTRMKWEIIMCMMTVIITLIICYLKNINFVLGSLVLIDVVWSLGYQWILNSKLRREFSVE